MAEEQQAVPKQAFSIEKLYVKDASLEVPNAPAIFLERDTPNVEIQLHTQADAIDEGLFEVTLTVNVTAKLADKSVFLVEVAQAGIFQVVGVAQEDLEPILSITCPNILFPYAREVVSDLVTRAGFPTVILSPVNFEAMYMSRSTAAPTEPVIIQ